VVFCKHEYGVDLDKVAWLTIEDAHVTEHRDPANCHRLAPGSRLAGMMLSGELDAVILGGDMPKDPRVQTLIPNAAAAAQEWYQREGVIPINHMFVVRTELSKERPEVVRDIYRMIVESRKFAPESATRPPIGLEANRKGLELAIRWSYEQKIIPRRLSVDELFDDTDRCTGDLSDRDGLERADRMATSSGWRKRARAAAMSAATGAYPTAGQTDRDWRSRR